MQIRARKLIDTFFSTMRFDLLIVMWLIQSSFYDFYIARW